MSSGAHSNFSITERLRHLIRLPRPVPYHAALGFPHFLVPTALCPWWLLAAVRLQHQRAATLHSRQNDTRQAIEWHSFKLLSRGPVQKRKLEAIACPPHMPTQYPSEFLQQRPTSLRQSRSGCRRSDSQEVPIYTKDASRTVLLPTCESIDRYCLANFDKLGSPPV